MANLPHRTKSRPVPSLTQEMTMEILSHLSVKDLLRYRSVCKAWRTLIDSPSFIRMQLKCSKLGLFINGQQNLYWLDLDTLDSVDRLGESIVSLMPPPDTGYMGCCNGLIIATDDTICNPSTRNYMKLSPLSMVIGFGYDPLIDDYKLVIEAPLCGTQLHCVKAKTWKKLSCSDAFSKNYGYHSGHAFVENRLYWMVWSKASCTRFIFSLDLQTEKHSTLAFPFDTKTTCVFGPVEFEGCICVVRCDTKATNLPWSFEIWGMRDHKECDCSWTMLFSLVAHDSDSFYYVLPLKYYKTTNQILLKIGYKLFLYDLKTNTYEPLNVPFLAKYERVGAFLGVQSLVGF
ncbi:F-box protein CPR1-like [Humulus lupulus]|uniref:F-box protein CPR1-like n=1 Tax=Humulus lupulus TaxID=3486 RepID=UPI002B41311C|nr:F-box protein CPR1-like [Humulus lupulus]